MPKSYAAIITPIISMFILTLGNGLFTTITTLQLKLLQVDNVFVGIVAAAYFAGLIIGAYSSQKFVVRVGHIRAYAVFASMITVATLLQGLFPDPWLWILLRLIVGYGLAGLFIVIDSWVLASSDSAHKGRAIALYMLSYYVAQSLGQLMLNIHFPDYLFAYGVIGVLAAFSILPVAMTHFAAPKVEEMRLSSPWVIFRKAPLGIWTGLVAGVILGVIYSIYPLYLLESHLNHEQIATAMFLIIFGGALLQVPIGKLSDQFDRRKVLLVMALLLVGLSLSLALVEETYHQLLITSFIYGGISFTIYPMSISLTGDRTTEAENVAALSVLTLFYGFGSALGPLSVTGLMQLVGLHGFFMFLGGVSVLLVLYIIWRILIRDPASADDRAEFNVAVPERTSLSEEVIAEEADNQ